MPALDQGILDTLHTHYYNDLTVAYQRKGGLLKPMLMGPRSVQARTVRFDVLSSTREAVSKPQNGIIPTTLHKHGHIEATIETKYDKAVIDGQDLTQIGHPNMRMYYAMQGMEVIGRWEDDKILEDGFEPALTDANSHKIGDATTKLTLEKTQNAIEVLAADNVGRGGYTAIVSPSAWADLMANDEFTNADYIEDKIWGNLFPQMPRVWNGCTYILWSGLPKNADGNYDNYIFDRRAVGFANAGGIQGWYSYDGDNDNHYMITRGDTAACLIQPTGVVVVRSQGRDTSSYENTA